MQRPSSLPVLVAVVGLLLLVTIGETSFLIKRDNGLERLVIAIDERLASSKDVVTSPNLTNGTATYHCHTLLENLKVREQALDCSNKRRKLL